MWAGSLVFTLIFLFESMLIQDGHADPSSTQLNVGTMPQLLASVYEIAVGVL